MSVGQRKRFDVLERDGFACKYCGRTPADGIALHVDHVHPIARGGTDAIENLVTACSECNLGKLDRILTRTPGRPFDAEVAAWDALAEAAGF